MAYQIPTSEPETFVAGDSWDWDVTLSDFPPSEGWELSYTFICRSAEGSDHEAEFGEQVTANAANSGYEVRIPASETAPLQPGTYDLSRRVVSGDTERTVPWSNGRYIRKVLVLPNPALTAGAPTTARRMLTLVSEAMIDSAQESSNYQSVTANGRAMTFKTEEEKLRAIGFWSLQVALEENPTGEITHKVAFVRG